MDRFVFSHLPARLNLQIFNMLKPVAYVRLRRTCREVNTFCESNRRHLKIRLKKGYSGLALSDYSYTENQICEVRAEVKLMARRKDGIVLTPLTTQASADFLRAAISGFYFTEITIGNYMDSIVRSATLEEQFQKAAGYFAEATAFLRSCWVFDVINMSPEFIAHITRKMSPTWLSIKDTTTDILDTRIYQKTQNISLSLTVGRSIDFVKIARNKKTVYLQLNRFDNSSFCHILQVLPELSHFLQMWKCGHIRLNQFRLFCEGEHFDTANSNRLGSVEGLHYLGYYCLRKWGTDGSGEYRPWNRYYEYWLYPADDGRWGLIQIYWDIFDSSPARLIFKDKTTDEGFSRKALCRIVRNMYDNKKVPLDCSGLYEELRGLDPINAGKAITRQVEILKNMQYKGCRRRNELVRSS